LLAAAKEIASPNHHVADVHPDPEFDATVQWHSIVGFRPCGLRLDGALDRVNGACKFRQHAVASRICDPAAMRCDQAVQNMAPFGQFPKRSDLIPVHQAAIAFNVGCENCHKLALNISHLGHNPPETADIIAGSAGGTPQIQVAHPVLEKRLDVRFGFKSETESELTFVGERAQYGFPNARSVACPSGIAAWPAGLTQTDKVDNRRPEHDANDQTTGSQFPDRTRSFSKIQMPRFPIIE
jgi:hypothetical protein